MSPIDFFTSRGTLYLVVTLCLLVSACQRDEPIKNYVPKNFDTVAQAALGRVKSGSCRNEIANFVDTQVRVSSLDYGVEASCPHIYREPEELGCFHVSNLLQLTKMNDGPRLDNTWLPETCIQFCLTHGYAYAAHRHYGMSCYCSEQLDSSNVQRSNQPDRCYGPSEMVWFKLSRSIREIVKQPDRVTSNVAGRNNITIAFVLTLNGRSLLQVRRLLRMIYAPHHVYYMHVDARQHYLHKSLKQLATETENVILVERRRETIWGGSSLLLMILEALEALSSRRWDYLINLSESDLPLKSIFELEDYLSSRSLSNIYLKFNNLSGHAFIKKQGLDQSFYQCEQRMWGLGKRRLPFKIIYSGGSDWFALPRKFCDTISSDMDNPQGLVKSLLNVFNYTLLPVESFFHTLALNTKHCDHIVDSNLRITNWNRKQDCGCQHKEVVDWCGCSPVVYRWADLSRLEKTKTMDSLFFSRKFDPTISSSIIQAVEHHLVNKQNLNKLHLDTRYWLNVWELDESSADEALIATYIQFGLFGLNQLSPGNMALSGMKVQSIDLYFVEDRSMGVLFKFCEPRNGCIEIIISEKNLKNKLKDFNPQCFQGKSKRWLDVIEVNQDFDVGERTFKNHLPLHSKSKLVVYHEWLLPNQTGASGWQLKNKVQFQWTDPRGQIKLGQEAKLSSSQEHQHLYLAHRLNMDGPLKSGVWRLTILDKSIRCLDYQFLIFDEASFELGTISQQAFDHFYSVTNSCVTLSSSSDLSRCEDLSWSLTARDAKSATYRLR